MTRIITVIALAIPSLPALGGDAAPSDAVRRRAEQACYDDVNKLCADTIPDEDRITACMKVHRSQLSPRCRSIFDANAT